MMMMMMMKYLELWRQISLDTRVDPPLTVIFSVVFSTLGPALVQVFATNDGVCSMLAALSSILHQILSKN